MGRRHGQGDSRENEKYNISQYGGHKRTRPLGNRTREFPKTPSGGPDLRELIQCKKRERYVKFSYVEQSIGLNPYYTVHYVSTYLDLDPSRLGQY